jgi:hypothetical protein
MLPFCLLERKKMKLVFDIEASGLLNDETIDYTASPYVLKDHYKFHCLVIKNIDTGEVLEYDPDTFKNGVEYIKANATTLIGHNIVDYDLLALKLGFDFDYTVYPDTICGRPCTIIDTLVLSKTLNADRLAHSLDYLGKLAGVDKIDWRGKATELGLIDSHAPKGEEFKVYHPAMLEYNRQDVEVNHKVYNALMKEWGTWDWQPAFELEMAVRDIVTKQSHRGFYFDVEKAKENVRELDILMQQAREIVEPLLPPRKLSAAKASETTPPKIQFKKDGTVSANMIKFAEKVGGAIDDKVFKWNGKDYQIPMPLTPLIDSEPASIEDTTHIKGWLVDLGWWPTVYKERDLTVDSKKKKLTKEKYKETVERYMAQTVDSPFKRDRMFHLTLSMKCKDEQVLSKLLSRDLERPVKVYTNPTFTVGQDKELCPKLEEMSEIFPHVYKVVEFLTYRHRRNSILGGGVGIDEDDVEMEKGYLANIRADGRIPTPADTCGCNTSRFKHRIVANIPRITSMYGKNMRAMFGVERKKYAQFGYDFSSLEGRMESHYCWKYDDTKEYCNSLILEKPFDVHTLTAKKISEMLGKPFGRSPAKSTKYCCTYGGRPMRVAMTIGSDFETGKQVYDAFWLAADPLRQLGESLKKYWESIGGKKFVLGIDGRKVPTRSASALVNSLLQSAGVICAKWTMVLHDRKLAAKGLTVDFFRDNWKNKSYINQMVAMHDEAQMEVSKGLIEWKIFKEEDEAIAFKKSSSDNWSEVGHIGGKWFVGKSVISDLLLEAVDETTAKLKLNIPLGVEFIYGDSWATCH